MHDSTMADVESGSAVLAPAAPVTKRLHVKTGRHRVMGVVREHYLREDIPCRSPLCFEGCRNNGGEGRAGTLPADVTHYLLPLEDVLRRYLDVLESSSLRGVIYLQSLVAAVQASSLRHYRRVCAQVRDAARGAAFFPDEFCRQTRTARRAGESAAEHRARTAHRVAEWYYEHLGGQRPVVVVTDDPAAVERYASKRIEVFVVTLGEYLDKFWPQLEELKSLYEGIRAALEAKDGDGDGQSTGFEEYLRQDVLESGVRSGKLVQGKLQVNKHHAGKEAFVVRQGPSAATGDRKGLGEGDGDILICGSAHRNRAVHGDVVVVVLLPKSEWRSRINRLARDAGGGAEEKEDEWERRADVSPTGRVVGVLQRNWREYVAVIPREEAAEDALQRKAGRRILTVPYDRRVPKIRVLTAQAARLAGRRIVVSIDAWPVGSQYPNGHFVRALGEVGDLETEVDGILLENNISVAPFSQGVLREMPSGDGWAPDVEEVARRRDLRSTHAVMSIDPAGCEDVDDTLSVKRLKSGNLELGVHIADVAHFVAPGSLADQEAAARATTVYLADRRYDMLPAVLSSNLCSLLGGVDRYAVSVLWELDPKDYSVVKVWYGRTVIRSAYKLFYEAAQDVIDGAKTAEELQPSVSELQGLSGQGLHKKYRQLRDSLLLLSRIAQRIQDGRERGGALRLEGSEVRFEFEARSLTEIRPKEHLKVHETVAECMIFANHWVAKKIAEAFPDRALLRRHPPPKKENFEELKVCAASRGWHVDVWSNNALAESLDRCVDPHDPNVNLLLRQLATHAMVQAVYFSTGSAPPEEWAHYGLALDRYTHFTSPIRRYADVVVHRLLLAALEAQDWWENDSGRAAAAKGIMGNRELEDLMGHVNERNRAAQQAQRASQLLFQTLYFKDKAPDDPRCVVDAVVFAIRANGFLVYVPRYALKGAVHMQDRENQVLFYRKGVGPVWTEGRVKQDANALTVETAADGKRQVYRLFDHVTVTIQMRGTDAHPHSLAFYFLANRRHKEGNDGGELGGPLKSGEVNFLKELRKEIGDDDDDDVDEDGSSDQSDRQEPTRSKLYDFFQEMKLMGRENLSATKS